MGDTLRALTAKGVAKAEDPESSAAGDEDETAFWLSVPGVRELLPRLKPITPLAGLTAKKKSGLGMGLRPRNAD